MNERITSMDVLIPVDDVIDVSNVIKGENVSYPQVVWNFGDNYIDVIKQNFENFLLKKV